MQATSHNGINHTCNFHELIKKQIYCYIAKLFFTVSGEVYFNVIDFLGNIVC